MLKENKEYSAGERKCWSCYWWEFENVHAGNKGRCTLKYFKCERKNKNER